MSRRFTCCAVLFAWILLASAASLQAAEQSISYHAQIRPIFQAHCQGCHQPAKPLGQYIMTDFQSLLTAGESAEAAIVPGKPDDSYLVSQITPVDGEAQMPKGKAPLSPEQIELIRQWIAQGATNDSPASASQVYDAQHPPVYTTPPVTTSLDFSPDGKLLAIAGHHEVLIHHADGSGIVARLIGLSDRIESVAFSPDGTLLAVTGGAPARMGEVQVWNVADQKLVSTTQVGYDTLYGASWSPDGSKIAFGCPDNSLRVIEAATGKEVLFQGSHGDWVLDTTFSVDGSHVVSVGRDQTAKLTEFETQRFVDNITSITPGALKGGLAAVETHPQRDEILVGGADGVLRTYRMQRETNRVIGDDANLVRMFPVVPGRIFDVGYSPDASLTTAVSSHNGQGYVTIFQYGVPGELPAEIKAILGKRVAERNAEETKKIDDLITEGVKTLAQHQVPGKGSYSLAFAPDGKSIAVASTDGIVRFYSAETGELQREFSAYPLTPSTTEQSAELAAWKFGSPETPKPATPPASKVVSLEVLPAQIQLNGKLDYAQILVTAVLENGDRIDATRAVTINDGSGLTSIDAFGLASPAQNGTGSLQIQLGEINTQIPLQVSGCDQALTVDYVTHVTPILSKLGCNQGTCHGSAQGKAGFKLSLRGYDPLFDVRALVDDHASRRANTAVPDESLMILKSIGGVPHQGGQLTTADHKYYQILRGWVEQGAVLKSDSPKVVAIDVFPKNPTIQQIGSQQQIRVLATYADGTQRDVTYESFVESGNTEVATINKSGLLEAVRRGEASILARYEGSYAATTLTVMGDRTEFVWQDPPTFNHVDDLTAIKWQRLKIQPSELCTDEEFIRRVTLDLTGLPPTSEAVHAFINDQRPAQEKRDHYIDQLVGSDAYVTHMTNKWADLLQVNGKFLGREGATLYRNWIREQVAANRPYDEFVREIVTASGSNKTNPAASYYKILRTPEDTMENTTHLFLGVRFNCNKCHDHPFERWTQDQYYETAAYFAHVGLRGDPEAKDKFIGGTAVEGRKPLYEIVFDKKDGDVVHQRTNEVTAPEFPFAAKAESTNEPSRRQQLADWLTSPDNQYFAKSYVNRLWGYLFGVGIIEPIDDIRAGNPPTNPELLDFLTQEFINSDFNVQHVVRLICKSRTYQLSLKTNRWNEDDQINFSHAKARRLPAETLYDSIHLVTGAKSKIPGVPPGTRAAELSDSQIQLNDGFLNNFGRPSRESACECERTNEVQLGPVMALVSGQTVADAISDPNNALPGLVSEISENAALIDALYVRILNRNATSSEIDVALPYFSAMQQEHEKLSKLLVEKEEWWKPIRQQKEQERLEKIAAAEKTLAAYKVELAPRLEQAEAERKQKIEAAQSALAEYNSKIQEPFEKWLAEQKPAAEIPWDVFTPSQLTASNKAELKQQEDGSILATAKDGIGNYELIAQIEPTTLQAFRLEALTDPQLPGMGPGLPPNGNFVVTEFEVFIKPLSDPNATPVPVKLDRAQADFSQDGFDIKTAIDGSMAANSNGWAVSPQVGITHWATFQTKEPVVISEKSELKIVIHQRYTDKKHWLGKFRISTTAHSTPVPLGLPKDLLALVNLAERTPEQNQELISFFQRSDAEYQKRKAAIGEAQKPLPPDPELVRLEGVLKATQAPVADDPALVELRSDVAMSQKLLENDRLTVAQDLTWALINSPAFLFNR